MSTQCWVPVPDGSPFPLANLPYGVVETPAGPHVVAAVGEQALDLGAAAAAGLLPFTVAGPSLDPLLAAGRPQWTELRRRITELLTDEAYAPRLTLLDQRSLTHLLPFTVADYTDFFSFEEHVVNASRMLRPDADPLPANWRHLPVGYYGRAGTVVVSGTPVRRPSGQRPSYGPTQRLDFEAEVGFVVGTPSRPGGVATAAFADHVFGALLVSDWSARDIQAFESGPLGPSFSKSFATSTGPWVVPLAALEAARVPGPPQDPEPAPYLRRGQPWGLDLAVEVRLNGRLLARPPFKVMYWTPDQQLAHLTVGGPPLRTGDLFASGTVSGDGERGCLLEVLGRGPGYLADGDTVAISASAPAVGGGRLGFGELTGEVCDA